MNSITTWQGKRKRVRIKACASQFDVQSAYQFGQSEATISVLILSLVNQLVTYEHLDRRSVV